MCIWYGGGKEIGLLKSLSGTELELDSAVAVATDLRALSLVILSWWQRCHQIWRYQ